MIAVSRGAYDSHILSSEYSECACVVIASSKFIMLILVDWHDAGCWRHISCNMEMALHADEMPAIISVLISSMAYEYVLASIESKEYVTNGELEFDDASIPVKDVSVCKSVPMGEALAVTAS